jgi:hypothetical protein
VNGAGMPSLNAMNGTPMVGTSPPNGGAGPDVHGAAARRSIRHAARLLPSPLR